METFIGIIGGAILGGAINWYFAQRSSEQLQKEANRMLRQVKEETDRLQHQLREAALMLAEFHEDRIKVNKDGTFERIRERGQAGFTGDNLLPSDDLVPGEGSVVHEEEQEAD
jgi:gas vesicle protein